ncbi:MAG: hypothetical protein ACJ735_10445 [Actinomycetes bacterium]
MSIGTRATLAAAVLAVGGAGVASAAVGTAQQTRCSARTTAASAAQQLRTNGTTFAQICVGGTRRADSSVTVSRDPSAKRWYVIYQGRRGDAIPSGYVGADSQAGATIVGCDTGTYNPQAKDKWNQSPHSPYNNAQIAVGTDEFTAPTGPIGPGDPCSPFVPHTPPGKSCGSPQNTHPATALPKASPLQVYAGQPPASSVKSRSGQVGIAGDFGGGKGAAGYLQATADANGSTPKGNVTTGGNSRGGGGTVAVGNDGNETDDPYTPKKSPVVICQD